MAVGGGGDADGDLGSGGAGGAGTGLSGAVRGAVPAQRGQQDPIWEAPPAVEPMPEQGQTDPPAATWPFEETTAELGAERPLLHLAV